LNYKQFESEKINTDEIIENSFFTFQKIYDKEFGGFGERPKFPSPHNLLFLLNYYLKTKNESSLEMVNKTLIEMRLGGIFDHIGYGFHRYSTDKKWFLPHFEKMLYDQAMLTIACVEAFQITGNDLFKKTTEEILTYVLRDMTSEEGGFFSAEDADSEGEEGKFYVWTKKEVIEILGSNEGELFSSTYNVTENGNYFEESNGKSTGTNIPFLSSELSANVNDHDNFESKISELRNKLFELRERRIHPFKDDKILTDWNGLMIVALAKAGRILKNDKYLTAAVNCINFIYSKLFCGDDHLLHSYRNGKSSILGQLDDHSFLIWGLLELYDSTFDADYLLKSVKLTDMLIENYWDKENNNGFYFTSLDDSNLIARPKDFYDGAIPSGNSVMYINLQKLFNLTANHKYIEYSENLSDAISNHVMKVPTGHSQFLSGLVQFSLPSYEIIIVCIEKTKIADEMIELINSKFELNKIVMLITENNREMIKDIAPFTSGFSINDETTVYVCKNHQCSLPTTEKKQLKKLLSEN
jgi:uncharacterized protein YyaL (SSP411 family)